MKQAKISDLKNNLSRYLELVRKGETIQVLDRDVPVALIISISEAKGKQSEGRMIELERKGVIRRGDTAHLKNVLKTPAPGKKTGALQALLEEREEQP